uniref:Putative ATPbinding transport protein n=1 Tax=termite gut metagenome TaxID=433724 RepID=S0DFG6_9ZZZZ
MRRGSFYPRLALGNLWRNRGTYAPYLLACAVSVFTFYTMLAINLNGALDNMRSEAIVKSFTLIGTIILAIFCGALIFYTNSFLVKRRKKELGLYSILGMEKRNIASILFFETLFVAAIALVLGLALGLLLSRLLYWVLLRMVRFPVLVNMPASPAALGLTAAFFGLVFLLALLSNLRQVRLADPIALLAGARQGEREPKASVFITVLGLLCVGAGYFLALYFTAPTEALMLFLLAAFLVIIGTYCLFTSGSIALLKLLRKNRRYYYQPKHFIAVSGMLYRMKQNAAGLASICVLSCMVLVTVSSTVSLNAGAEDSLLVQYPYEVQLLCNEPADGDPLLAAARQTAEATGTRLQTLQDYRTATYSVAEDAPGVFTAKEDVADLAQICLFELATLEDYNRSEGTNAQLAEGEALLFLTGGRYEGESLTAGGLPWRVTQLSTLGGSPAGTADLGRSFTLILPNAEAQAAVRAALGGPEPAPLKRSIAFNLAGSAEGKAAFLSAYNSFIGTTTTAQYFQYRNREDGRQDWYATNGGFLFLGVYFGVLFLMAATLIIYYKQISEGYDDAERFDILQKVGMGQHEVKQTINGQILTVFLLPLVVAVVHIAVAFFPVSRAMVIFGVINTPLLAAATALTVLAYALVYLLVFRRTATAYYRIVRRS